MSSRVIPPFLQQGDKVAIAATARKVSFEEINPAIEIFKSWGLEVIIHPDLFNQHNQFAGTDESRAALFQTYLNDDSIKAIICARGGYGTVRIIDKLDFGQLNTNPKWVVGYSDVTALHSHIHAGTSICTLHATMPINMQPTNANELSINMLYNALFGKTVQVDIPTHELNRLGSAQGELVGGNLSVLYSLIGSRSDIDTTGKILFLEDLDEYLYHIDRMMQALKRSGKLTHLAALVIGGMSDMRDNAIPFGKSPEEIIWDTVSEFNYPVCYHYPAGHLPVNLPLTFGRQYTLTSDQKKFELR